MGLFTLSIESKIKLFNFFLFKSRYLRTVIFVTNAVKQQAVASPSG